MRSIDQGEYERIRDLHVTKRREGGFGHAATCHFYRKGDGTVMTQMYSHKVHDIPSIWKNSKNTEFFTV